MWKGNSIRNLPRFNKMFKISNQDYNAEQDGPPGAKYSMLSTAFGEIRCVKHRRPPPASSKSLHIKHLRWLLDLDPGLSAEWPHSSPLWMTHFRPVYRFDQDLTQKCALAEALLRVTLDLELELATGLQEAFEYWSDQLDRPVMAWVEIGPWAWISPNRQAISIDSRLSSLRTVLRASLERLGEFQLHLTSIRSAAHRDDAELWLQTAVGLLSPELRRIPSLDDEQPKPEISLEWLQERGHALLERIKNEKEELSLALGSSYIPSIWKQKWYIVSVAVPAVLFGSIWMLRNREKLNQTADLMRDKVREFFRDHLQSPARAIYNELVSRRPEMLTDQKAIEDAKRTLERMLNDFLRDSQPNMPEAERLKRAKKLDMTVVSDEYARSVVHSVQNLITGDIVRMLLIQVQFIQKELLVAMTAMEELMDENELNMRVMATVPTFMLCYFLYRIFKGVYYKIHSRMKSREETYKGIHLMIQQMERLLNLRSFDASRALSKEEASVFMGFSPGRQDTRDLCEPPLESNLKGLENRDIGRVLLLVYGIRKLIWSAPRRFTKSEKHALQIDLSELMGEEGPVSVTQQLTVLQRMYRSYKFLQHPGKRSFL